MWADRRVGPERGVNAWQAWYRRARESGYRRAGNELVAIVEFDGAIDFILRVNGECRKLDGRWKPQMGFVRGSDDVQPRLGSVEFVIEDDHKRFFGMCAD